MSQARDKYQRKVYAVMRMNVAMARLSQSANEAEKAKANSWVAAWKAISGLRQFKLERRTKKQS